MWQTNVQNYGASPRAWDPIFQKAFAAVFASSADMPADFNWAVGGEAGDGIDSTGKIFAQALSRAGRHVFTSKDFASYPWWVHCLQDSDSSRSGREHRGPA